MPSKALSVYLTQQLNHFFPDTDAVQTSVLQPFVSLALERLEHCFLKIRRKYFFDGQYATFSHLQSDQYAMFLYWVSNTASRAAKPQLAAKVYCLNKALHSIDVYYEVELPNIFLFRHCVGTVLGRANYADYFTVGQNCTVGNNRGIFPTFKENVAMYAGATVVGNCLIGSNCHVSAHAFVRNEHLPDNTVAFGKSPNIQTKHTDAQVYDKFFNSFKVTK